MNSTKLIQYGTGAQTVFNTPNAAGFGATVSSSLTSYVPVISSQSTSAITLATAPPANCKLSIRYFIGTQVTEEDSTDWTLDASGNPAAASRPGGVTGAVIAVGVSRNLTAADNGNTLDCTASGLTLTIPSGTLLTLGVIIIPNGATSVASSGGTLLNGSTTTIIRDSSINGAFAIIPRTTVNSYVLTGN